MKAPQTSLKCFVSLPPQPKRSKLAQSVSRGVRTGGYQLISDPELTGLSAESVASALNICDAAIFDISQSNPNVFFEIGLAHAMGKPLILMADVTLPHAHSVNVLQYSVILYDEDNPSELSRSISKSLRTLAENPQLQHLYLGNSSTSRIFIDWEKLDHRETENLSRELLSQMGFQNLDWGKGSREIDMLAELPKRDPDGFEYRELWLISFGNRAPFEMIADMLMHDPDYLFHRLLRHSEYSAANLSKAIDSQVTLLLVVPRKYQFGDLDLLKDRLSRSERRGRSGFNVRLRIWDQDYMTTLIHRYPSLAYKYFSDEARIRSQTRKSYQDLYSENVSLLARLTTTIQNLEDERNKRVRAERDAVWKDISFAAAHKIGNPLFAIETNLAPLTKRIRDIRLDEALEVVSEIESSVEKAKGFVDQFKSLARAQQISQSPMLLRPLLEDALKTARGLEIICELECDSNLVIFGDPERLAECFDELVANAVHWLSKPEKKITIKAASIEKSKAPDFLDSSREYVVIDVTDSGAGVKPEIKTRIFDAFFTTRDQGTGLGLALVRRIVEGHGGSIIEMGLPDKGAHFELFLPSCEGVSSSESDSHSSSERGLPGQK